MGKVILENIVVDKFNPFGASEEELVADALDVACLRDAHTLVNGRGINDILQSFYKKRENFKLLTRLGDLLVSNQVISKEQLEKSLQLQQENPSRKIGDILLEEHHCSPDSINEFLEKQAELRGSMDELACLKKKMHLLFSKMESLAGG